MLEFWRTLLNTLLNFAVVFRLITDQKFVQAHSNKLLPVDPNWQFQCIFPPNIWTYTWSESDWSKSLYILWRPLTTSVTIPPYISSLVRFPFLIRLPFITRFILPGWWDSASSKWGQLTRMATLILPEMCWRTKYYHVAPVSVYIRQSVRGGGISRAALPGTDEWNVVWWRGKSHLAKPILCYLHDTQSSELLSPDVWDSQYYWFILQKGYGGQLNAPQLYCISYTAPYK